MWKKENSWGWGVGLQVEAELRLFAIVGLAACVVLGVERRHGTSNGVHVVLVGARVVDEDTHVSESAALVGGERAQATDDRLELELGCLHELVTSVLAVERAGQRGDVAVAGLYFHTIHIYSLLVNSANPSLVAP